MKVLVALDRAPFTSTPERAVADALVHRFREMGHEAELLELPHTTGHENDPAYWLAVGAFGIMNVDRLVTLTFPAHLLEHPHKTCWAGDEQTRRRLAEMDVGGTILTRTRGLGPKTRTVRKVARAVVK